ncbi:MAG: SMC-Scp complex subunit ScpB [Phycisphaerales bacterium]|nr:SMC-Scp complex subunit ScpB [Phycisphaerales bacterium]
MSHDASATTTPADGNNPTASSSQVEEPLQEEPLSRRIEAVLAVTDKPLGEARLGAILGLPGRGVIGRIKDAIAILNEEYASTGRAFRAQRVAGGYRLMTEPLFGPLLARLRAERQRQRLSQAALETLSIIAYRQPVMRAEVEAIRGVSCGEVLRGLLERRLIRVAGRAEELGRPLLYGTTKEFLIVFGLADLEDLPEIEGLEGAGRAYGQTVIQTEDETDKETEVETPDDQAVEVDADGT